MSAVVVSTVSRPEYPTVQDIIRKVYAGQECPAWTELIEAAAVEDDTVMVLIYPKHVAFMSPSRVRELFGG